MKLSDFVIVLVVLLCVGAGYLWLREAPSTPTNAKHTSTGTLGKYQFESQEDMTAFNKEAHAWFSKHGFVPYSDKTYADIVAKEVWKIPGILLRSHFGSANEIFVFIPDSYRPTGNIQILGYHMTLQGLSDTVRKRASDFEVIRKDFQEAFPSTWEYKPEKGEQKNTLDQK